MKNAFIVGLLLLNSSAFIGLVVDENVTQINIAIRGDSHAQLMWGVIECFLIIFCFFHGRQFVRVASRQPLILAFVGWAALSLAWSEDPQLTARRVLGLICTTAMGFVLGMKLDTKALLRLLVWAMAIAMLASVIAALLFPSFGVMANLDAGAWRGVFTHKNELGHSMGIALIVLICLLWESRQDRPIYLILLFLGVALLVLSKSVTSIIVTILTLSIGLYRRLRLRPAQRVAFLAIALLVGLAATVFLQSRMDSIFAMVGRNSTLTGRVPVWQLSADAVLQRPLLGAGWDAFWPGTGGDHIRSLVHWDVPHAHNGFLEMSLNIGLIGLVIFLICNYDCFRRALRWSNDPSQPFRLWPLLYYSFTFLFFFTEAPAVDRHTLSFVLFCAISVWMTEARGMKIIEHEKEEEYMPSGIASDSGMVQESQ
jgi:exopolysaccharide production protein ExoQ